jgi:hypothetical protein
MGCFFSKKFLKIKMSRVPNTKLSNQWGKKKVEHVSKLIISKFGHVHGHNKKNIMTSTKIQFIFYPPPMARIDTYQYNILSSRSVRHHIVKQYLKWCQAITKFGRRLVLSWGSPYEITLVIR